MKIWQDNQDDFSIMTETDSSIDSGKKQLTLNRDSISSEKEEIIKSPNVEVKK